MGKNDKSKAHNSTTQKPKISGRDIQTETQSTLNDEWKNLNVEWKDVTGSPILDIIKHGLVISGNIGQGKSELAKYIINQIKEYKKIEQIKLNYSEKELERMLALANESNQAYDYSDLKHKNFIELAEFKDGIPFYTKDEAKQIKELTYIRIFDIVFQWKRKFLKAFPYQSIDSNTRYIAETNEILYDLDFKTVEKRATAIKEIIKHEYDKRRKRYKDISNTVSELDKDRYIYCIEEANVILNTKTVKGFWLDFVSTARNFNMTGIYIMQRMADSSTKVIERCPNFAIGHTKGANDLRKIYQMIEKKDLEEYMKPENLKIGEFLMILGDKCFKLEFKPIQHHEGNEILEETLRKQIK